jgi:hypothetical protein
MTSRRRLHGPQRFLQHPRCIGEPGRRGPLILSADPNLTPAQVEQIVEQTAAPMPNSAVSGAGLVQVDPAVAAAEALVATVIVSFGSTKLVEVGSNYCLESISSGAGPELRFSGAPVVAGTLGGWTPIGAERRPRQRRDYRPCP